jgi:histidine triad (HIT) family protein
MMARSSSLKTKLLALGLRLARWRVLRPLVGLFFRHMDRFLPADRLYQNKYWVAFEHPQPSYALHLLIVPRQGIPSLQGAPLAPPERYADLIAVVQELVKRYDLAACGYRLITNGGPYQSVPQWHWHLVSDTWQESHD